MTVLLLLWSNSKVGQLGYCEVKIVQTVAPQGARGRNLRGKQS